MGQTMYGSLTLLRALCGAHKLPTFLVQSPAEVRIFILHISLPEEDLFRSRIIEIILFKPLGCLLLKSLLRMRTTCINDGHASYFTEVPSILKLVSLPVVSGASLCLTFSDTSRLASTPH